MCNASGTLSFGGLDAPTLRLLGTGISTAEGTQVSGDGGCNTFTGRYTLDDARVTVGPLASTRRACPEAVRHRHRSSLSCATCRA